MKSLLNYVHLFQCLLWFVVFGMTAEPVFLFTSIAFAVQLLAMSGFSSNALITISAISIYSVTNVVLFVDVVKPILVEIGVL